MFKNTKNPFFSIIIPLYNEESRLKNLLKIYEFMRKKDVYYELILINDGSTDNTLKVLKKMNKKIKFILISYEVNKGKGFAIKTAMLQAKGKYRLFTDIDLSTPIEELEKLLPYLKKEDIIIGSRKIKGSNLRKRQPLAREVSGKGFTLLSQIILNLNISDFTCGFKCFSRKAAIEVFKRQQVNRWGFDSEILFIAKRLGFSIREIPVTWADDPRTKVKFPHAIISSLKDLYKIRSGDYS